jgi:hypothetical protein
LSTEREPVLAALAPPEVVEVDGINTTSLSRTVFDLAGSLPFEQSLVVGDPTN